MAQPPFQGLPLGFQAGLACPFQSVYNQRAGNALPLLARRRNPTLSQLPREYAMSTNLHWKSSAAASCWHTLESLAEQRVLTQPTLAEALRPFVSSLAMAAATTPDQLHEVFDHLIPLSAGHLSEAELARVSLSKTWGPQFATRCGPSFASVLRSARQAFEQQNSNLEQELQLRRGPLEQQWQARGPGLLAAVRRLAEPEMIPDAADVILVLPVVGGAGATHIRSNAVHLEAVLTDPHPSVPEIVRLGWLLALLNLDLPRYADHFSRGRLYQLGRLAMVPVLLAAAEEVELARCEAATVAAALTAWQVAKDEPTAPLAESLWAWWQTYHDSQSTLVTALHALDRLLASPG